MKCRLCAVDKLSEEFPCDPLTPSCQHGSRECLRCLVKVFEDRPACPRCQSQVPDSTIHSVNGMFQLLIAGKQWVSAYASPPEVKHTLPETPSGTWPVELRLLDGTSFHLEVQPEDTLVGLKSRIEAVTKVSILQQRIVVQGKEIQELPSSGGNVQLHALGIAPGSVLHLVILLFEGEDGGPVQNVVFDLSWKYPGRQQDYLDGSCLAFTSSGKYIDFVDFQRPVPDFVIQGVQHSGDVMSSSGGSHRITIETARVPQDVGRLYFTLSAYDCDHVRQFRAPTVRLFDRNRPNEELSKYSIATGHATQAIIMCVLLRMHSGWRVIGIGKPSQGNAKNYNPIINTISSMPIPLAQPQ